MKFKTLKIVLYGSLMSLTVFSCVPQRQYLEMKDKREACDTDNKQLKSDNQSLVTKNTELSANIESITKRINALQTDTMVLGTSLRRVTVNYDQLYKTYELLLSKNKELLAGNVSETGKLSTELQNTQERLLKKEDELKKLEKDLDQKKSSLEDLSKQLTQAQTDLKKKEDKLNELQSILDKKDSTVKALKEKVSKALNTFENNGLTVNLKNGKVYVSLEESLLFASGSFTVNQKGIDALKDLSKVLEANPDINIMIEGHTDNVPFNGGSGQLKDNWDLSVMRATAIVKILVNNGKVEPKRLIASGRSQYSPLDNTNTKEGRSKNRRTEIILTPKLDELFKVLESN